MSYANHKTNKNINLNFFVTFLSVWKKFIKIKVLRLFYIIRTLEIKVLYSTEFELLRVKDLRVLDVKVWSEYYTTWGCEHVSRKSQCGGFSVLVRYSLVFYSLPNPDVILK